MRRWKSLGSKRKQKYYYRVYTNSKMIGLEYFDFEKLYQAKRYKNWIRQGKIKKITAKTHLSKY